MKKRQHQPGLLFADKRPREYAEEIGKEFREWYRERIKAVPEQYRDMVTDHVLNTAMKNFLRRKK